MVAAFRDGRGFFCVGCLAARPFYTAPVVRILLKLNHLLLFRPRHFSVIDDSQLIEQTLAGDRAAFNELVTRYQDRLFASMLGVTGSSEEAEDVVQDAFVRAFVKLDSFQQSSQFFTWLYRIAFNTALSRHRRRRNRVSLDQVRETTGLEPVDDVDSPDEPMLRRERVAMVRQAMEMLSEEHVRSWCSAKWTTIRTKRSPKFLKSRLGPYGAGLAEHATSSNWRSSRCKNRSRGCWSFVVLCP